MEDKLRDEIKSVVTAIFESKKETEQRDRTQQALETAGANVEALSTEVKDNKETITSLEEEKSALEAKLATVKSDAEDAAKEVETKLEAANTELEGVKTQFDTVSAELKDLKQEAIASTRMIEIEDAGVIREDAAAQKEKVKDMSDEDFASYKEELVSVRKSVLAELEAANKAADSKDGDDVDGGDAAASKKDEVKTPPANIDTNNGVSAALNAEISPSDDLLKEYASLGQALADDMVKKTQEGGE